jgi:RNA polymerase sigma-70 factor (ECF subfamily)
MKEKIELEEIFIKFHPIVGFKVKKFLGYQNPDCDDVVNEIMTNVIEKIQKNEFRGDSSIGTFIYTITNRRIIDYIRQKSKTLKEVPTPKSFPSPDEELENKERAEQIAEAIKKLKPKYREVLYLYYYEDLSRREVAHKLSISPKRVSERVDYAQKLLKKVIKK